jgi:hypothetical protein
MFEGFRQLAPLNPNISLCQGPQHSDVNGHRRSPRVRTSSSNTSVYTAQSNIHTGPSPELPRCQNELPILQEGLFRRQRPRGIHHT